MRMRTLVLVTAALLSLAVPPASAQSLNDEAVLSNDTNFYQRVRTSMIAAAIAISSDGLSTGINIKRHAQVQQVMNSPDSWKGLFAAAVATQSGVINLATANGTVALTPVVCSGTPVVCTGNADTQEALVTDAAINTAVAAAWNSFFGGQ